MDPSSERNVDGGGEEWQKVKELGRGSYGIVSLWKKFSPVEKSIAVKIFCIPREIASLPDKLDKLQRRCKDEVDRMYNLNHEHIVRTMGISSELDDKIRREFFSIPNRNEDLLQSRFLGMEYCDGGDLLTLLWQPENLSGLPEAEVLTVLRNISDGMEYLHSVPIGNNRYIIHRDIKPGNILIKWKGGKRVYVLGDLGLAKDIQEISFASSYAGTEYYKAPEITRMRDKYDKTVDYWSFGLVAYEVSCGSIPPINDQKYVTVLPPRTHLSDFFRNCLNNWIPTMVEYQSEKRGKYSISNDGKKEGICSLAWLKILLNASFLQIYTCMRGREVFRVKSGMTVADVQKWITHKSELVTENQLILTQEGIQVKPEEMVLPKAEANCKLYMVAKFGQQICPKTKVKIEDKILSDFVTEDPGTFEMERMKELWKIAIFYIQTQLERTRNLLKIENALKNKETRTGKTASMIQNENSRMVELYKQFRDHRSRFMALVEMQEKLDQVNEEYISDIGADRNLSHTKSSFEEFQLRIEAYFQEYFKCCNSNDRLNLKATTGGDLKHLYQKLLQQYKHWVTIRTSPGGTYTLENVADVRATISSFLTNQQTILVNIDENMKLLIPRVIDNCQSAQAWLQKAKGFGDQVMDMCVSKQKMILEKSGFSPISSLVPNSALSTFYME